MANVVGSDCKDYEKDQRPTKQVYPTQSVPETMGITNRKASHCGRLGVVRAAKASTIIHVIKNLP